MRNFFLPIFLVFFGLSACETGIDVNASYQQIPVVYGFLELNEDIQYIKINRSFLGEGNAMVAATNPDSSFFTDIEPVIEEMDGNEVVNSVALRDTILPDRPTGDFYSTPNKIYYFRNQNNFLEAGKTYRLRFMANGKEVSAETVMLENFRPNSPSEFFDELPNLVRSDAITLGRVEYQTLPISLLTRVNARIYQSNLTCRYKTVYVDGRIEEQVVEVPIPDILAPSLTGGQAVSVSVPGQEVYAAFGNNAREETEDQSQVRYREIGSITVEIAASTNDFNTYLESVAPSTGVVLEKPQFTNINFDTDLGVGIFTSRNVYTRDLIFDNLDLRAFAVAAPTEGLRFCTFDPVLQGVSQIDCRNFQ